MDGRPDWAVLLPDSNVPALIMQKLIVKDSARSITFYTEALGMRVMFRIEAPELPFSEVIVGYSDDPAGARLVVSCAFAPGVTPGIAPHGTPFPSGVSFTNTLLQAVDIPAMLPKIEQFGGKIAMLPHKTKRYGDGGALLSFIQDPDGHVLEFFQFAPFEDTWPDFVISSPPESLLALYGATEIV